MTRQEEIQREIAQLRPRLQARKEQAARYGISADPSITIEVEELEERIAALQAALAALSPELPAQKAAPPPASSSPASQQATLNGSGAISQGSAQSAGEGGVVGAAAGGDIITGSGSRVIHVQGDYIEGSGNVKGDIRDNTGVAVGQGHTVTVNQGLSAEDIAAFFAPIYQAIAAKPELGPEDKEDLQAAVTEMQAALNVDDPEKTDDTFIKRRLRNIERIAPDIVDLILSTVANPIAGMGVLAAKIKAKAEEARQARTKRSPDAPSLH